ncbi:hypothetical protein N9760_04840, partial [Schleiferiaceae bacterium]|nr:hypothetical protein [Schleiferiaceae bacterium]
MTLEYLTGSQEVVGSNPRAVGTILIKIVSGVVVTERITWMKKSIYLLPIDYEKELSIHTICANLF